MKQIIQILVGEGFFLHRRVGGSKMKFPDEEISGQMNVNILS